MTQSAKKNRLTLEQYAALERGSDMKHEYCGGEVFAMAGGSPEHSLVSTNVTRLLGNLLAERPCIVFNSDMSVYIEATNVATYPDALVICGPVQRHPVLENSVLNPVLIVEVLSPSTEAYDRGAKFSHYKRLPSLTEYLLVATDRIHVDHFIRDESSFWRAAEHTGLDASMPLASIPCELRLRDVYAKIELVAKNAQELSPHPPGVGQPIVPDGN